MLHYTPQRSFVYEHLAYVPQVHLSASAETTYLSVKAPEHGELQS